MKSEFQHNNNSEQEDSDLVYLFELDDEPDLKLAAAIHDTMSELKLQSNSIFNSKRVTTFPVLTGEAADRAGSLRLPPLTQISPTNLSTQTKPFRQTKNASFFRVLAVAATLVISLGGICLLIFLASQSVKDGSFVAATPLPAVTSTLVEQPTNQITFGFEEPLLKDWALSASLANDYAISLDTKVSHSGHNSVQLSPNKENPTGFGALAQQYDPTNYLGKRVRFRGFVKTEGLDQWAGLILRVDGPKNSVLNFDNMQNRPITGSTNWKEYSIVLDVPADSTNLYFGILMEGSGKVWLDDVTLEAVSTAISVTSEMGTLPAAHSQPVNMDFENTPTINDWWLSGDQPQQYTLNTDKTVKFQGQSSGLLKFNAPEAPKGYGAIMQTFSANQYIGKRVRLSGYIKTQDVKDWAGLWMRIDGEQYKVLGFDNMVNRPIKGTSDWQKYEIVLDIPAGSVSLNVGAMLTSEGQIWLDNVQFEVVDASVPTTNLTTN